MKSDSTTPLTHIEEGEYFAIESVYHQLDMFETLLCGQRGGHLDTVHPEQLAAFVGSLADTLRPVLEGIETRSPHRLKSAR